MCDNVNMMREELDMNNIDIVDMDILKDEELFELNKSSIKMCLEMEYGIDVEREIAEKEYTNG